MELKFDIKDIVMVKSIDHKAVWLTKNQEMVSYFNYSLGENVKCFKHAILIRDRLGKVLSNKFKTFEFIDVFLKNYISTITQNDKEVCDKMTYEDFLILNDFFRKNGMKVNKKKHILIIQDSIYE